MVVLTSTMLSIVDTLVTAPALVKRMLTVEFGEPPDQLLASDQLVLRLAVASEPLQLRVAAINGLTANRLAKINIARRGFMMGFMGYKLNLRRERFNCLNSAKNHDSRLMDNKASHLVTSFPARLEWRRLTACRPEPTGIGFVSHWRCHPKIANPFGRRPWARYRFWVRFAFSPFGRNLNCQRGRYHFAQPPPLRPFQFVDGPVDLALQRRLIA